MKNTGIRMTGLLLGLLTGTLTTLFDAIMLWKLALVYTYIPQQYPIALLFFNLLFWTSFSLVVTAFLTIVAKNDSPQKNDNVLWLFFYLLPFTLIYGILGSIPLPLINLKNIFMYWPKAPYDRYLYVLWIGGLFPFLFFKIKKGDERLLNSPLLLMFEISTVILIFHFCSNLSLWFPFHYEISSVLVESLGMPSSLFNAVVYLSCVIAILGLYLFFFFNIRPRLTRWHLRHWLAVEGCLILFVCGILYWSWALSHRATPLTDTTALRTSQESKERYPDILLIVLDTLRADHLTVYNKNRTTSPNLESFAQESLVFDRCIAPSSWTVPSHASLFSGLYSSEHGCDYGVSRNQLNPLNDSSTTIAEILHNHGYATAAIVSNVSMFYTLNLFQGFQYVDLRGNIGSLHGQPFRPLLLFFSYISNNHPEFLKPYRTARDINYEAKNLLAKVQRVPLFLFLNYMDVHSPNLPPKPFNNYFLHKPFPRLYGIQQFTARVRNKFDKDTWDAYIQSQYDAEIAYLDHELGKLFDYLKHIGRYDSSLIVVTADHGELLGEHGLYEHRCQLYEGVIRVPLIIKLPGNLKTGRISKLINLTDVYATILSLCNLPIPENVSAKPFGGSASGISEIYTDELGDHKALSENNYKYMEYRDPKTGHVTQAELYDLSSDPKEEKNLITTASEQAIHLRLKLQEWGNNRKPLPQSPAQKGILPENIKEKLKALGYVQ